MSNHFGGTGNLADAPSLKTVKVNGEDRKVAEMRVFFDKYKPDGQGGFEQVGGFWLDVSVWGRRAEQVADLCRKGARVSVSGSLEEDRWMDKETGEERSKIHLVADEVSLSLSRIESVQFRAKRTTEEE